MATTFIQWKGTDVCMDVDCNCGKRFRVDGWFGYFIKCPYCHQVYECGTEITLIAVKDEKKNNCVTLTGRPND